MALLPVWIETWQLDCCGDDLLPGDRWSPSLLTFPDALTQTAEAVGWSSVDLGAISFVADATNLGEGGPTLLDIGNVRVGVPDLGASGRVAGAGKLIADWHAGWEFPDVDTDYEDIAVEGTVRSVRRLPIVYETRYDGPVKTLIAIGHRAPVDVASTKERRPGDDLLIELELSG